MKFLLTFVTLALAAAETVDSTLEALEADDSCAAGGDCSLELNQLRGMKDVNYHDALMEEDEDEEAQCGRWRMHQQQGPELLEEKRKEELRPFTEPVRPFLRCRLRLHQELHAGRALAPLGEAKSRLFDLFWRVGPPLHG